VYVVHAACHLQWSVYTLVCLAGRAVTELGKFVSLSVNWCRVARTEFAVGNSMN